MRTLDYSNNTMKQRVSTTDKCGPMQRTYVELNSLKVEETLFPEFGSGRALNEVSIHNVVSIKQSTRTIKHGDINGNTFKVKRLVITDIDGNETNINLFLDNGQ